jgi:hypothetical protein
MSDLQLENEVAVLNDDERVAVKRDKILSQINNREFQFAKLSDSECALLVKIVSNIRKEKTENVTLNQFGLEDERFETETLTFSEIGQVFGMDQDSTRDEVINKIIKLNPAYEKVYTYYVDSKKKKGAKRACKGEQSIALFERVHFDVEEVEFYFNRYLFWV